METPLLDAVTVSRFVLDDFVLTDEERALLQRDEQERYRLDDCVLAVAQELNVSGRGLELWRERRAA